MKKKAAASSQRASVWMSQILFNFLHHLVEVIYLKYPVHAQLQREGTSAAVTPLKVISARERVGTEQGT